MRDEAAERNAFRFRWERMVRRDTELSDQAKVAGLTLSGDFFNRDTGQCNPTAQTLADTIGISLRAAQRRIAELQARGYLIVTSGKKQCKANSYELKIPGEVAAKAAERERTRPARSTTFKARKYDTNGAPYRTKLEPKGRAHEAPPSDRRCVLERVTPLLIAQWTMWLRSRGLDAEKLDGLTVGDLIELPSALPPDAGHWRERSCREWFAHRFATIEAELRRSA